MQTSLLTRIAWERFTPRLCQHVIASHYQTILHYVLEHYAKANTDCQKDMLRVCPWIRCCFFSTRITSHISLLSFFIYFLWPKLLIFTLLYAQSKPSNYFSVTAHITQTQACTRAWTRCAHLSNDWSSASKQQLFALLSLAPQLHSLFDCFSSHYSSRLVNDVELFFLHKLSEQHYKHAWNDSQILFLSFRAKIFRGKKVQGDFDVKVEQVMHLL